MSESETEITIDDIADAFAASLERGEKPTIEQYKSKYPQLAERIEAVLPALLMLDDFDSQPKRELAVDDSIPQVLGEYEIVQEIGRGGMGVVFEARHITMWRRVALKVLPKSLSEQTNYLSRFLSETRSAGQLHHTNIVPVFEVGEAEGIHFYSMQFIHGDKRKLATVNERAKVKFWRLGCWDIEQRLQAEFFGRLPESFIQSCLS